MTSRPRWLVVGCLGTAQILAWGMSYYLIAVLAKPIETDTAWGLPWIVGGLSIAFLISGLVSPKVGRLIDRFGGRPVLAASAILLAIGLATIAAAPTLPVYLAGWCVLGAAMGAGLYDPAFATIGRIYGDQARSAITLTTLYGGFASTVCWPLSAVLVEQIGWRGLLRQLKTELPFWSHALPQLPRLIHRFLEDAGNDRVTAALQKLSEETRDQTTVLAVIAVALIALSGLLLTIAH